MCIICKDWMLGKLTVKEAWRNLNETVDSDPDKKDDPHYYEVVKLLLGEQDGES